MSNNIGDEVLDAIEIIVNKKLQNVAQICTGVVTNINTTTKSVNVTINGHSYNIKYYGESPTLNLPYPVFIPYGNMSLAFMLSL